MKKWNIVIVAAAVSVLLGGCAMGGATGDKTTQGVQALESGDYTQAQQLFTEALQSGEQEMLAYRGLGLSCMGLAQYEDAEAAFTSALSAADDKMPENRLDLRLYLAAAQYRLAEYEKAVDTCTTLLEDVSDGNEDAYYLRGASELHEGNTDDAKKDFDRAVAFDPTDYDLYLNIYETYSQMNLSGVGGDYLQSALSIQGEELVVPVEQKYEPAMDLIGQVYLAQGDYAHAKDIYSQMQTEFGESVGSYNGLALCAIADEDYDGALSYISQGLALDGTEGKQDLYFNEIVAYEKKLDFVTAKTKAEAYVASYPADEAGQKEWTFLSTRE